MFQDYKVNKSDGSGHEILVTILNYVPSACVNCSPEGGKNKSFLITCGLDAVHSAAEY